MPPNRKGAFETVDHLATLNVESFVYKPLTSQLGHNASISQQEYQEEDARDEARVKIEVRTESPKLTTLDSIVEEERIRQLLSSDHVVETIQKSHVPVQQQILQSDNVGKNYWDEETPDNKSEMRGVHTILTKNTVDEEYWAWTEPPSKQDKIRKILQEEKNRHLLSSDHMVETIQKEAFHLVDVEPDYKSEQNDAYWTWETPAIEVSDTPQQLQLEKDAIIHQILESEKIRQQFSVATIEEQLKRNTMDLSSNGPVVTNAETKAESENYWYSF